MYPQKRSAFNRRSTSRWRLIALGSVVLSTVSIGTVYGYQEHSEMTKTTKTTHSNHLKNATSPYLLQHAHNPVNWYEWGEEAFAKAKSEDKPIFLSIGYSACHWCHVMAHESFESEEIAAILNEHFISIKVDREERPDIDEIYMAFTQALTQHGGWPMSVWLSPDATPFHAGTYFPKEQFKQLITGIAEQWKNDRERITGGAANIRDFFKRWASDPQRASEAIRVDALTAAASKLASYFDTSLGGISSANNKFPPSLSMDLLLRIYKRTGTAELFQAVEVTLDHMAHGGIYDHLGGGICRYSTDPQWLVPHFEKMLYDQALVSNIYLDAYQLTKKPLYKKTAADIFDYVMGDLQSPEGGFYSARDADSDGLEGAFYIWTVEQVHSVLGQDEGELFCSYYDVTQNGNWFERLGHAPSGPKNILHISKPPEAFAKLHRLSLEDLNTRIESWRTKMLTERAKRTPPGLDDKVLTAWNGLMIASLAKGARVLDEPKYAQAAAKASRFVLDNLQEKGRLLRTYRNGQSRLTAYLNDYAFLIAGLINLYEATFDQEWLDQAKSLMDTSIQHYHDDEGGAFYFTADDSQTLIARSKQPHDGAIASGNSVQAMNLLRLSVLLDNKDYRKKAETVFRNYAAAALESPTAFDNLLCAVDFSLDRVKQIAIIGDRASADTKALLRCVYDRYLPNKVVVGADGPKEDSTIPLLRSKTRQKGRATAYVCENYRCRLPVTSPEALAKELNRK